jgi:HEPN domain-containing protein
MQQAKFDLEHARKGIVIGDYDWACFAAQQSAEKAVKAVHMLHGAVAWGHSVLDLLEALSEEYEAAPSELLEAARRLDRHHIATRCPDAHPAGPPRRYYTEAEAQQAVTDAEKVVTWCDAHFAH